MQILKVCISFLFRSIVYCIPVFHCNHDSSQAAVYALKILLLLILTAGKNLPVLQPFSPTFRFSFSKYCFCSSDRTNRTALSFHLHCLFFLLSESACTSCFAGFRNIAVRSFSFLSDNIVLSEFPGRHPDMFGELLVKMALGIISKAVGDIRD